MTEQLRDNLNEGNDAPLGTAAWLRNQAKDPLISAIIEYIKNDRKTIPQKKVNYFNKPLSDKGFKKLAKNTFIDLDGILRRQTVHQFQNRPTPMLVSTIVVPRSMVSTILFKYHTDPRGSDLGKNKTTYMLCHNFWWPNMRQEIKSFIKGCIACQSRKPPKPSKMAPMQPYEIVDPEAAVPFSHTQSDVIGPFPRDRHGFKYALVVSCHLTKAKIVVLLKDNKAQTVSTALITHVAVKCGPPHVLVTDQGSEYTAEVTHAMAHYLGIDHAFAPAYRHNVVA